MTRRNIVILTIVVASFLVAVIAFILLYNSERGNRSNTPIISVEEEILDENTPILSAEEETPGEHTEPSDQNLDISPTEEETPPPPAPELGEKEFMNAINFLVSILTEKDIQSGDPGQLLCIFEGGIVEATAKVIQASRAWVGEGGKVSSFMKYLRGENVFKPGKLAPDEGAGSSELDIEDILIKAISGHLKCRYALIRAVYSGIAKFLNTYVLTSEPFATKTAFKLPHDAFIFEPSKSCSIAMLVASIAGHDVEYREGKICLVDGPIDKVLQSLENPAFIDLAVKVISAFLVKMSQNEDYNVLEYVDAGDDKVFMDAILGADLSAMHSETHAMAHTTAFHLRRLAHKSIDPERMHEVVVKACQRATQTNIGDILDDALGIVAGFLESDTPGSSARTLGTLNKRMQKDFGKDKFMMNDEFIEWYLNRNMRFGSIEVSCAFLLQLLSKITDQRQRHLIFKKLSASQEYKKLLFEKDHAAICAGVGGVEFPKATLQEFVAWMQETSYADKYHDFLVDFPELYFLMHLWNDNRLVFREAKTIMFYNVVAKNFSHPHGIVNGHNLCYFIYGVNEWIVLNHVTSHNTPQSLDFFRHTLKLFQPATIVQCESFTQIATSNTTLFYQIVEVLCKVSMSYSLLDAVLTRFFNKDPLDRNLDPHAPYVVILLFTGLSDECKNLKPDTQKYLLKYFNRKYGSSRNAPESIEDRVKLARRFLDSKQWDYGMLNDGMSLEAAEYVRKNDGKNGEG